MGILNITPDSFSDGGELASPQAAAARAGELLAAGADVLDIGGESTRPGHAPVSEAGELARVLPAIEAIRRAFPAAPISIDTYKPAVARAAVRAGADIVNDVWGGRHVPDAMPRAVAELRCPVILMHNRGAPDYTDFWPDVLADLRACASAMTAAGVAPEQIWLDPGFGFAKDAAQNLEVLKNLSRIAKLGYPVLLGTSRKSTIGRVLKKQMPSDREDGTAATLVWGIQQGARMVRVHDVAAMRPFVEMADAIRTGAAWREGEGAGFPTPSVSQIENTHSDSITLSRMRFNACHGALPQEKTQPQPWEVTVTVEMPLDKAAESDDLSRTIDYRRIHKIVRDVMEGEPVDLAETLAHRIAGGLLEAFPIRAAEVEVCKCKPPVDFEFDGLRVRVRSERGS